jgi:fatty-acyl-CoA synthase
MFRLKLREEIKAWWKLPLLTDYVKKWAEITPENPALISADTGVSYTYREFDDMITLYALRLRKMGISEGDVVVTQWLSYPEFFILTYACLTIGAIVAPLDVRLQSQEVIRDMQKIQPIAFFCMGNTPIRDFREVAKTVQKEIESVQHIVQWTPGAASEDILDECLNFEALFARDALFELAEDESLIRDVHEAYASLNTRTPQIIIFTTGTTGAPKPALMCHENTIINNAVFSREVCLWGNNNRYLNSMPTSHIAGICQGPMTIWYTGGTVVTLGMYNPLRVLEKIQEYRPTWWAGVPTMFRMLWSLPDYAKYDLSSLLFILYGGSAVDVPFLEKMAEMAPSFGTALGLTESSGYFTATPKGIPLDEMAGQVGQVFPDLAPVTIRQPMNEDGTAGEVMPAGEVGEICVHGPLVFLGYYNDAAATAGTISKEGILYSGDMGAFVDYGAYQGLRFAGRRKFVIKPKGYLVFPDEVSAFIAQHPKVKEAQVVGVDHETFVDGVFAFVQPKSNGKLTEAEIFEHCKGIAAYKRPLHVSMWSADRPFPMNRVGKNDVTALTAMAEKIVEALRSEGGWDRS